MKEIFTWSPLQPKEPSREYVQRTFFFPMAETIGWYFLILVLLWQTLNDVLLGMVDASLKRYLQTHPNPAGTDLYSKISCVYALKLCM